MTIRMEKATPNPEALVYIGDLTRLLSHLLMIPAKPALRVGSILVVQNSNSL